MKLVGMGLFVGALLVGIGGCTADYAQQGNSPVLLLITGVNGGLPLNSDVLQGGGICPDLVPVRLENKQKNPNLGAIDYRGDLVVERYEVRYFRSDGRGTQGVDVPYSISGSLAAEVIQDQDANLNIEVVRRQAKLEPPLIQLQNSGGQALIVTMFAEITLYARTTIGQGPVTAKANLQIDFSDFVDAGSSCPTN
jgi:hypothetical protein